MEAKYNMKEISTTNHLRISILLTGILFLITLNFNSCIKLRNLWLSSKDFNGLWIVPLFALLLIWQRYKLIKCKKWHFFIPSAVVLLAIVFFEFYTAIDSVRLKTLLLILTLALLTLSIIGYKHFELFISPFIFSLMVIPPPMRFWMPIKTLMQEVSFVSATTIYKLMAPIRIDGFEIFLLSSSKYAIMTEECSGARSLLGLCILGSAMIIRSKLPALFKIIFTITIPIIAVLTNTLRTLTTLIMRDNNLDHYTRGFWHGMAGIIFFLAGLLLIYSIIKIFSSKCELLSDRQINEIDDSSGIKLYNSVT